MSSVSFLLSLPLRKGLGVSCCYHPWCLAQACHRWMSHRYLLIKLTEPKLCAHSRGGARLAYQPRVRRAYVVAFPRVIGMEEVTQKVKNGTVFSEF